jgi:hypothetical protein
MDRIDGEWFHAIGGCNAVVVERRAAAAEWIGAIGDNARWTPNGPGRSWITRGGRRMDRIDRE